MPTAAALDHHPVEPATPSEVTPRDLIASVREARAAADAAEIQILELAVAWAIAHPVLEPAPHRGAAPDPTAGDEPDEWHGIPEVRWDAPAAFAAANRMTTEAGRALIRDALVLAHRLPRLWARVTAHEVPAWRARRVAQRVLGSPDDVVAYVDAQVAHRAEKVGLVGLDRILDDAMAKLYPEEREAQQLEALDARHATLHEQSLNESGVAEMTLRGD